MDRLGNCLKGKHDGNNLDSSISITQGFKDLKSAEILVILFSLLMLSGLIKDINQIMNVNTISIFTILQIIITIPIFIIFIFLVYFIIFELKMIITGKPFLIFNKEGIYSHGLLGKYSIKWTDCKEWRYTTLNGRTVLHIRVKNHEKFLKEQHFINRILYKIGAKKFNMYGMEFSDVSLLKYNFNEVVRYVSNYLPLAEDSDY